MADPLNLREWTSLSSRFFAGQALRDDHNHTWINMKEILSIAPGALFQPNIDLPLFLHGTAIVVNNMDFVFWINGIKVTYHVTLFVRVFTQTYCEVLFDWVVEEGKKITKEEMADVINGLKIPSDRYVIIDGAKSNVG